MNWNFKSVSLVARAMVAALQIPVFLVAAVLSSAQAGTLDGTKYAVIAPTFYSASGSGTQSYIRLFSGAGGLGAAPSTFNVTVVGNASGSTYGSTFAVQIPYMASVQFTMSEILSMANAGAPSGIDTGFAVWLQDSDIESGYEHVTYNATSGLFENLTNCGTGELLNARMAQLHNELVLTNVHSSKLAGGTYPSTVYIYNYTNSSVTYNINVYNGGNPGSTSAPSPVAPNSGKYTCQYGHTTVVANTALSIPESSIESFSGCTLDSDEYYLNLLLSFPGGTTSGLVSNLVTDSAYSGVSNLTDMCAVNKTIPSSEPFLANATNGNIFALSAPQSLQAYTIALGQGTVVTPLATLTAFTNPTATVSVTASGFNLTLPDGVVADYTTATTATDINSYYDFETASTDGNHQIETILFNTRTPTLSNSSYGYWIEYDSTGKTYESIGTFGTDVGLTAAQMPSSGSASYTGNITGLTSTTSYTGTIVGGTVSLSANFAANTITGTITGITTIGLTTQTTGNVNALTLSGTISGTGFSGTVTPSPATGTTPSANLTGLSGTFAGTFSSANVPEMVGNITISGGRNSTTVAAFGAHQ